MGEVGARGMDYKGIGVVFVRQAVRELGPEVEARLLAQLDEDERRVYEEATASAWVPIEIASRCFELAAPLVHPGKALALRQIGRDLAFDNMRGVYRVFMRVMTVEFVLSQAARLWGTYHRHGSSRVVRHGPKDVDFVVTGYPRLPERFRECMCGWIIGTLELVGGKSPTVSKSDDDPNEWHWRIRWQ